MNPAGQQFPGNNSKADMTRRQDSRADKADKIPKADKTKARQDSKLKLDKTQS